jgi:hypothetical protein
VIFSSEVESLLRGRVPFAPVEAVGERGRTPPATGRAVPWGRLALIVLVCGAAYGAMMGVFSGLGAQMLLSALKIPILILASTLLTLPSILAVNTVCGLRADLPDVLRGIFAAQATVAVSLHALGPLLLCVYASSAGYALAKAANGLLFLVASLAGQRTLHAHYAPLILRDPRHRAGLRVWWYLYSLVTIQMAWVLRPFIGSPGMPFQFFREEAWGNAYVQLLRLTRDLWLNQG